MPSTIRIYSTNYSGETANITFLPDTGGTVNIGSQVLPYDWSTDYYYGNYELYFSTYNQTCYLTIPNPNVNLLIEGNYSEGSIGAGYNITASSPLDFDAEIQFQNYLGVISGPPILINVSITLPSGETNIFYQTFVNENYSSLNKTSTFSSITINNSGTTTFYLSENYQFDVTPSPTETPTNTPTPSLTPTNTPTNTPTQTSSETPSNTPTNTETPTNTPTQTSSETPSNTPTNTETPTNTPTNTNTQTPSNTPTNTQTPTNTPTNTNTQTPSNTPSNTSTGTPTQTPTNTQTPTGTIISTTPSNTPSITASQTNTPSITASQTNTPTVTNTQTTTPTPTKTQTPTPTKLNGNSIAFVSSENDYLSITGSSAWAVGTGDFTVETFAYQTNNGNENFIFSLGTGTVFALSFSSGGNRLNCYMGGSRISNATITTAINTWYHLAITRSAGTYNAYFNGTRIDTLANTTNITDTTSPFYIGVNNPAGGTGDNWPGNFTNFRFVKGTAVYTGATYTVPTSPLIAIPGTELLLASKTAATFTDDTSGTNKVVVNNGTTFSALTPFV